MKDRFYSMMHFVYIILLCFVGTIYSADFKCGFPGVPLYGTVTPNEAAYKEGATVMYACRVGHILLGSSISRCKGDGTWSEDVPVCDDSMTTLVSAFSTPTVPGHPAELAIDKNKEKCTYLQPKDPRWWRIDFEKEYTVLSVAITMMNTDKHVKFSVFVIQIHNQIASYKRCASFSGKFGTPTMVLLCAEGKGISGHKVHIEDYDKPPKGFFEICEVEIQVKKDIGYKCGEPSRSLYLEVNERDDYEVEYECLRGYKLVGNRIRQCQTSGSWSGQPPICIPIVCDELEPFENGLYQIQGGSDGLALEGSMVVYKCNYSYRLVGKSHRICQIDGSWEGRPPKCKSITCPADIPYDVGGKWRYQTVRVGSYATLRCTNEKYEGDNLKIVCTEDGVWSEPEARCLIPIPLAKKESKPRIVNQGGIIFGMVIAAIMIVVVLVGVYLYDQRRRNNKPELPSRFQEPPPPPPRPPPRSKGSSFKSAFKGFLNRDNLDSDKPDKNSWKTQSLPSSQYATDEAELKLNSKKALSYGESMPDGEDEAVVEVEILPPHRSGRKGVITPVPEEPENTIVDDVVIELDEADSNKDSSAKDNKTPSDYAAVDYEKKRQSRLLKEQDSIESSSTAPGSPLPLDESDKKELSRSSTPAKNLEESEEEDEEEEEEESEESQHTDSQRKREAEEEERKAKEEEERKTKEEEERKAKEEEERKAKEEEKKEAEKKEAGSRRRRVRDDPPEVEEKPVLRRLRRFQ